MFEAMGLESIEIESAVASMQAYFSEHLPTGAFRVWVAEQDRQLVASIGLVVHSIPPSPHNRAGKEAYIMNLVTLPAYRRQGIARRLLQHVLGVAASEGIPTASLHASADGRCLYERMGFCERADTPEMTRGIPPLLAG